MDVRFIVPRRPDGARRDDLWSFTQAWWTEHLPEIPIVVGAAPPGPFNRAAALNMAARGSWDLAVVLDADVVADAEQVRQATKLAADSGRMTLPFARYQALSRPMTDQVLAGGPTRPWDSGVRYRSDEHESSLVVIPRALWDDVGGFDERFIGWGQEDVAFAQAARLLGGGIDRVPGVVWHLYHSRSARGVGSPQYEANQARGQRYREIVTPGEMREFLDGHYSDRAERFARIYRTNAWNGRDGTRCGPGSSLKATAVLIEDLPRIVHDLGITSILDAGCGDGLWMPELPHYVGVDIVPEALEVARRRHPDRTYLLRDICADLLPATDAVLCRDALQHLSFADAAAALENFRRTGARYLLANTHRDGHNVDIATGDWFDIDLEAPPFSLGEPLESFPDGIWDSGVRYPSKVFGVWEL